MRVLEQAHDGRIRTAFIAVPDVVSYDIENLKLELNTDFNLTSILDTQLRLSKQTTTGPDFTLYSDFGARFIGNAAEFIEKLPTDRDLQKMDAIISRMYQTLQIKQAVQLKFEAAQR